MRVSWGSTRVTYATATCRIQDEGYNFWNLSLRVRQRLESERFFIVLYKRKLSNRFKINLKGKWECRGCACEKVFFSSWPLDHWFRRSPPPQTPFSKYRSTFRKHSLMPLVPLSCCCSRVHNSVPLEKSLRKALPPQMCSVLLFNCTVVTFDMKTTNIT